MIPGKTIVVDTSALCYASAHTLLGLEQEEVDVGVIFGFLRQIRSLGERFNTTDFVFCWDSRSSKRKDLFPEYKEKRGKKRKDDPELAAIFASTYEQIKKLKNHVLPTMGFTNHFEQEGYESDDLIADIIFGYPNCIVVTNDDDMLQLLNDCVIWNNSKKKLITAATFAEEWGIGPEEWGMVKAIAGCISDEVPGIVRVGPPTAIKYLNGTLPERYKAFKDIEAGYLDVVMRNEPLVCLPFEGTMRCELSDVMDTLSVEGFFQICNEFRFESFMFGNDKIKWKLFLRGQL